MNEIDEILRLAVLQLKAGRAHQARALANVARELNDGRAEIVLAVIAGALGERWLSEPQKFDTTCQILGLPVEESRACLAKALALAGSQSKNSIDNPNDRARP
jgi:hypothetical protein